MTSDTISNPARAGELAQQIVSILASEDSETRQRAISAAMTLLGERTPQATPERDADGDHTGVDLARFFDRGEKFKPADYAQLCAAYHYSVYGPAPFTLEEIRAVGADAGVVLPDRLDKTFKSAAHGGRRLFQPAGRAAFKPTAAAGLNFNERWGVKPGRRMKGAASPDDGD